MYEVYLQELLYLQFYENDGNERKTPKQKVKLEQIKHQLVSFPSPSIKWSSTAFGSRGDLKQAVSSLVGNRKLS